MREIKIYCKNINKSIEEAILQQTNSIEYLTLVENEAEADIFLISKLTDITAYKYVPRAIIADDGKYRLGELLNRVVQMAAHPAQYLQDISFGEILFSSLNKVIVRGDKEIPLTDREVEILYYLIKNTGKEVSRDQMLKDVWQYSQGIDTHTLETHIYRLRQKIEINADNPSFLLTGDGGYILNV